MSLLNSESLRGAKPRLNGSTCTCLLLLLKYTFSSLSLTGLLDVAGFPPSLSLMDLFGVSSWGSLAGLSPSLSLTCILGASSWEIQVTGKWVFFVFSTLGGVSGIISGSFRTGSGEGGVKGLLSSLLL